MSNQSLPKNVVENIRESVAVQQAKTPWNYRRHVMYPEGRQEFYDIHWRLHRDIGPAVIPVDGPPEFWRNGVLQDSPVITEQPV